MNIIEKIESSKKMTDAPYTLVLNRKSIQNFPNGQKVALYFCDKLKKYFSFTYDEVRNGMLENEFTEQLKLIEDVTEVKFKDNSVLNINKECVDIIINNYENLTEEDKSIFNEYIESSSDNFLSTLHFYTTQQED